MYMLLNYWDIDKLYMCFVDILTVRLMLGLMWWYTLSRCLYRLGLFAMCHSLVVLFDRLDMLDRFVLMELYYHLNK